MNMKIFAIFDAKAEAYNQPFFLTNEGQATRGFSDAVNDPQSIMGKHPADFTLFRIGTYNEETAEIKSESPTVLGVGVEFQTPT